MIDQDVKKFVLRALLRRNEEPLSSTEIKLLIRGAFTVAFTDGDLDEYITSLEDNLLIAGTNDVLSGKVWLLTPKGKIRAQALCKT